MVFGSGDGGVYAWQPRTGKPIWSFQLLASRPERLAGRRWRSSVTWATRKKTSTTRRWARIVGHRRLENRRHHQDRRTVARSGHGRQELAACWSTAACTPSTTAAEAVHHRRRHRQADRQARADDRHDHAFQPRLCRRQDLCLHDQRLARVSDHRRTGAKLIHKLRLTEEDEVPARRSFRTAASICRPARRCIAWAKRTPSRPPRRARSRRSEAPCRQGRPAGHGAGRAGRSAAEAGHAPEVHGAAVQRSRPIAQEHVGQFHAGRPWRDQQGRHVRGRQQPGAHGHDPDGQGRRSAAAGPHSRRARLPWKFDFSDGEVPVTWIGARYRHVVRDVDGNKVMVKVTTIPKGPRSQAILGPTICTTTRFRPT